MRQSVTISAILALALLSGCNGSGSNNAANVDAARLLAADGDNQNWLTYGRTYREERYSPLTDINTKSIGQLGLAWSHDFDTNRGQEATPIVVDGTLYTTSAWSKVYAFDARTGKLKWSYDPKVPGQSGVNACCDAVNRGVAVWKGKVFVGTLDGRLVALDAATGKEEWSVVTVDQSKPYTITGAPRVIKGKVLIGNGGAELGVRGYVTAYDADSGKQIWRFYTVPGDPSKPFEQEELKTAAQSWKGEWWKGGGGGTVWDSMSYDADLDLLYIGVGNGSPWNQKVRSAGEGDNLFTSSIVALKPDTGKYVWHYQTTPGETWDYTATQHMILADLQIEGKPRKVLMQAPKNGFFYVLDRTNGKLISAKNFVAINWAKGVDMKTGRPIENPEARYKAGAALVLPGPLGAHNWQPMAYSPKTGLVYIPAQETPAVYKDSPGVFHRTSLGWNVAVDHLTMLSLPTDEAARAALRPMLKGFLIAWDPVKQREVWRQPMPSYWNGGILATAGDLIFQGNAGGQLVAYDAQSGKPVWQFQTQTGVVAPPITYSLDGEQYIALTVGWGGVAALALPFASPVDQSGRLPINGRLLVFKLGGKAALPAIAEAQQQLPDLSGVRVNRALADQGRQLYAQNCGSCHGTEVLGNGVIPDLRYSGALADAATWRSIILEGALKDRGMVSFAPVLNAAQAEALRAYVAQEAERHVAARKARKAQ